MDEQRGERSRIAVLGLAVAIVGALVAVVAITLEGSRAAFSASTANGTNSLATGTVVVTDDDAGAVMFNLASMVPDTTASRCINVSYAGTVAADVRLYGDVAGSGLGAYLDMTVEIGSGATGGAGFDCAGFTATSLLHTGTLDSFEAANSTFATGLGAYPAAAPATRSYRVAFDVRDDNSAQGLAATANFVWEAQSL